MPRTRPGGVEVDIFALSPAAGVAEREPVDVEEPRSRAAAVADEVAGLEAQLGARRGEDRRSARRPKERGGISGACTGMRKSLQRKQGQRSRETAVRP